ncbi:retrovirus-related pol polyprotein from transposon TNT 1-94 [Tanacetum coccineum]
MSANKQEPSKSWGSTKTNIPSTSLNECRFNLEVAFRQHTCFIRNLEGVDLLTGSRGDNLYTLSLRNIMASSSLLVYSQSVKTKSWLWHRSPISLELWLLQYLARHGLVRGPLRLKFEKVHLCSAWALGKVQRNPHKPNLKIPIKEKTLFCCMMDLCGPMRVAECQMEKKYILVLSTTSSIYIGLKCLRSKDEVPAFIINFCEDDHKLASLIEHQLHCSPQQNGVVEDVISSGPALHEMTPVSNHLGLVPNLLSFHTIVPHFENLTGIFGIMMHHSQVKSPTTQETQTPILSHDVEEDNHDIEVAHMGNDPYFGIPIPEVTSDQSSSSDVIHTNWCLLYHQVKLDEFGGILKKQGLIGSLCEEVYVAQQGRICGSDNLTRLSSLESSLWVETSSTGVMKYDFEYFDPMDTPMVRCPILDEIEMGSCRSILTIRAFADADHAGCQDTRRSTSGSIQLLGDRLVSWSSKRQKRAAISSRKLYIAFCFGCCA